MFACQYAVFNRSDGTGLEQLLEKLVHMDMEESKAQDLLSNSEICDQTLQNNNDTKEPVVASDICTQNSDLNAIQLLKDPIVQDESVSVNCLSLSQVDPNDASANTTMGTKRDQEPLVADPDEKGWRSGETNTKSGSIQYDAFKSTAKKIRGMNRISRGSKNPFSIKISKSQDNPVENFIKNKMKDKSSTHVRGVGGGLRVLWRPQMCSSVNDSNPNSLVQKLFSPSKSKIMTCIASNGTMNADEATSYGNETAVAGIGIPSEAGLRGRGRGLYDSRKRQVFY